MNWRKINCLLIAMLLFGSVAFAQWEEDDFEVRFTLPSIALVDIEPDYNNSINFTLSPSNESGEAPEISETSNKTLWLNYSSSLEKWNHARSIVAEISDGQLPNGISLYLQASGFKGSGKGDFGKSAGKIEITNQPKVIISDVGNCYTGDGINNGHQLSFSIVINDFTELTATDNSSLTILYTISDN